MDADTAAWSSARRAPWVAVTGLDGSGKSALVAALGLLFGLLLTFWGMRVVRATMQVDGEVFRTGPAKVPLVDAVSNLTRVAVGVAGMATGRFDLLRILTVDRLHEQYRAKVFPQLPRLVESARGAGAIGACLSGAGSTVLAFSDSVRTITRIEAAFGAAAADTDLTGRIAVVSFRNTGAQVVKRL